MLVLDGTGMQQQPDSLCTRVYVKRFATSSCPNPSRNVLSVARSPLKDKGPRLAELSSHAPPSRFPVFLLVTWYSHTLLDPAHPFWTWIHEPANPVTRLPSLSMYTFLQTVILANPYRRYPEKVRLYRV